jgi:hypothetical protein
MLIGGAQLMTATLANTINEGRGKSMSAGTSGSIGTRSSHGVRAGGCAPVLCGGRGVGVAEMAVGGELVMATRAKRAKRRLDWKWRRKRLSV